jgi:uncharacterized membrane protein (DUF485 family)
MVLAVRKETFMSASAASQETNTKWDQIAGSRQFKDLIALKKVFVVPAFVFFVAYYFLLPILVGYAPSFMSIKVAGVVNIAYLFALSQFVMAWTVAWLYVRAANKFDRLAKDILENANASAAAPGGR